MTAYTAVTALAAVFHEQFQLLRLRFLKDHVVVCGLGRKGRQLTRDFHEHGDRLLVIERDKATMASACHENGVSLDFRGGLCCRMALFGVTQNGAH